MLSCISIGGKRVMSVAAAAPAAGSYHGKLKDLIMGCKCLAGSVFKIEPMELASTMMVVRLPGTLACRTCTSI